MKPEHKKYILENINKRSIKELAGNLGLKERKVRKFVETHKHKIDKKDVDFGTEIKTSIRPVKKMTVLASIVLIIILGAAAYMNSLEGKFIRDDIDLVRDNMYIKSGPEVLKFFTTNIAIGTRLKWNSYRPFQMITYALDYRIWGLNAKGYHFTNILLHILVVLCICWFISLLYKDIFLSLATSALFVVNPLHTETVAYISSRAASLSTLFILLCFIFYIKGLRTKRTIYYIPLILTYISALLSRENSLILPVLLLLYHYTWGEKIEIKRFLTILSIAFLYILLRVTVLRFALSNIIYSSNLLQRMPGFFIAITNYFKLMLLPFNLHTGHGVKFFSPGDPRAILGLFISAFLLIYAFRKRRTNSLIFFSVYWFFIALLPNSNLYPINAYMAESWLYLPSIGFFLVLAKGLSSLYKTEKSKIFAFAFIIILPSFHLYLTIRQNEYWREPIAFYKKTLEYNPDDYGEYNNLGIAYYEIGKREEAIAAFEKAIVLNPSFAKPYYNLGVIYYAMNKKDEAITFCEKAIKLDPRYTEAYINLGSTYYATGKKEEAIAVYKKAIELEPNEKIIYYNLGLVYYDINKPEESISALKKAIELNPSYADAYHYLGNAYASAGNTEEAAAAYKKARELNPNYVEPLHKQEAQ